MKSTLSPLPNKFTRSLSVSDERPRIGMNHRGSLPASSGVPFTVQEEVPIDPYGAFSLPMDIDGRSKYNKASNILDDYSHHEAHVNLAFTIEHDKNDNYDQKVFQLTPTFAIEPSMCNYQGKPILEDGDFTDPIKLFIRRTFELIKANLFVIKSLLFLLFNFYLAFAIGLTWHKARSCCDGVKLLVTITCLVYAFAIYYTFVKKFVVKPIHEGFIQPLLRELESKALLHIYLRVGTFLLFIVLFIAYTLYLAQENPRKIISAAGIFIFIGLSYLLSVNRPAIQWNQVFWGITFQFLMAILVLKTEFGKSVFQCIGNKIVSFLNFTDQGSRFVFGSLVDGNGTGSVFAFKVLPIIIFFSFTVSVLYHFGIMQVLVVKLGWFLQITIGSTACESLAAAGNIFLGMTETPLMIKPYLPMMTTSELFAVMTEGFATIAGSVLAAYINFGINASYLLSASVMAAPASLGIAKLIYPETEESKTKSGDIEIAKGANRNALEAGVNGAAQAVKLCSNVAANLIALLAFVSFLNAIVSWFGSLINAEYINFTWLLSRLFIPLACVMGVEWEDTDKVANLLGLKTFLNEFVAYTELAEMKKANVLSERSQVIATFALCGFSNICAIGIQMGGIGSLIPNRRSELASMALRAMVAGSIVTFISASMAGLLYTETPRVPMSRPTVSF